MDALNFIRGIVRPATLLTVVGGVVGLAVYYGVTVDAKEAALLLAAFGGPAMGFWFRGRDELRDDNGEDFMEGYDEGVADTQEILGESGVTINNFSTDEPLD